MTADMIREFTVRIEWFGAGAAWMLAMGTIVVGHAYRKMLQKMAKGQ